MRRRSIRIAQSSGSGIPADALGNLGDRYFDTAASRWYLKRWVGNFSGVDYVSIASMGAGTGIVVASCLFYSDGVADGIERRVISNADAGTGFRFSILNCTPKPLISGIGGVGFTEGFVGSAIPIGWHRVSMTFRVGGVDVYIDGVSVGFLNAPSVTSGPSLAGSRELRLGRESIENFKGCDFSVSIDGAAFTKLPTSEGAGTSIKDVSGAGRNGTLTDGSPTNFWYQAWVPMDLM